MVHKTALVLKAVRLYEVFEDRPATIGEVAKRTGYSKSTVRRILTQVANWGLLKCAKIEYKSTGKRVYWTTDEGRIWLSDYRGLGL